MQSINLLKRLVEAFGEYRNDDGLIASDTFHEKLDEIVKDSIGLLQSQPKKDWRIGLSCKPVHRSHQMYYETCHVVDVFPSGTAGIVDPDGVLMIKCVTGRVFLEASGLWQTR